jgi:hypothetical protein
LRTDGIKLTAKVPGFVAAGRRVENHTGAHTPNDLWRSAG